MSRQRYRWTDGPTDGRSTYGGNSALRTIRASRVNKKKLWQRFYIRVTTAAVYRYLQRCCGELLADVAPHQTLATYLNSSVRIRLQRTYQQLNIRPWFNESLHDAVRIKTKPGQLRHAFPTPGSAVQCRVRAGNKYMHRRTYI